MDEGLLGHEFMLGREQSSQREAYWPLKKLQLTLLPGLIGLSRTLVCTSGLGREKISC
jgi:hypothetical protein